MRARRILLWAGLAWSLGACGSGGRRAPGPAGFDDRPYVLDVSPHHDDSRPTALLIALHGYGSTGLGLEGWWQLSALAASRDILVAHPDGLVDGSNRQFWNATDACCDFSHREIDDVGYLRAVIADVSARYSVDPKRVYVTGHSNGGYMSHRMGCDAADVVAAIAPVSGVGWKDSSRCRPSAPMPVLEIMGTSDDNWSGWGDSPSTAESLAGWAAIDGCAGTLQDSGERLDLEAGIAGAETRVSRYACDTGAVELWAMQGAQHVFQPRLPELLDAMMDWLEAHRRP
jgi:polyhydroxybutyrate depolymerase